MLRFHPGPQKRWQRGSWPPLPVHATRLWQSQVDNAVVAWCERESSPSEHVIGQMKAPPKRAMPPPDVSCALPSRPWLPSFLACLTSQLCHHHWQEQLYQPSPWKNFEEHAGGSRITLRLGRTEYQTPLSRLPLPRTLTSSYRCTRRACGPVSFQRAGKGRGLSCCQSQASSPKNHRRTGRSVRWTQRARFSKESSSTASKPLLRALGASQITSKAFGRGDRRSTPSRTSSPPPERPSRGRDGTAAPRSTAPCAYLEMRDGDAGLQPSSRGCTSTSLPARDQRSTTRFMRCDVRDSRRTSAGPTGG
ncbi:unnamed protein product [Trichogramma brassicae]|uniref:Uncharacterized protein n=1 Tax=Trichogramma brassicae TaxID=86971 RepID=A0A6H5ICE1_9HYME|nr:unnamed protein product [Trichogramma brassicae]